MLHACFVRSPFAHAAIRGIDTSAAARLPGVRGRLHRRRPQPATCTSSGTRRSGPESPETPRPPLAEGEVRFVGDPVALVVAESRYVAEDAAELVEVDYEPLAAVVDYTTAEQSAVLVHEAHGSNLIGEMAGLPATTLDEVFASAAHVVSETIYQQAYARGPHGGTGPRRRLLGADTEELTIYSATQAPHEVRMFCSRLLGVPEHRVRVVIRDTGGGFGQKVMVQRDEMCVMLAAPKLGAPVKWVEDRRENLMAAGQSRHEHGRRAAWPSTPRARSKAPGSTSSPTAARTRRRGRSAPRRSSACSSPARTGYPWPASRPSPSTRTRSGAPPTAAPGSSRPWPGRCSSTWRPARWASTRWSSAAATCCAATSCRTPNPNGMPYDHITPLETFEQALGDPRLRGASGPSRPRPAPRGATSGWACPTTWSPRLPGFGYYATEAATIRVEPSGKVNVYIAGGSTGNSIETTVVQLTADALGVNIEDVATIQGDTALTGFGAGTAGSRSASMTAGPFGRRPRSCGSGSWPSPPTRSRRPSTTSSSPRAGPSVRGTPSIGMSLAEVARLAYFDPYALPPGVPAGLEASARYTADTPIRLGERHPRVHLRGRRRDRPGAGCCVTS